MKKKVLLTSALTIALCLSIVAGSSFALFTSESNVDIAVTSGTVKVTATATAPELSSTLESNVAETTATLEDNVITIDKMVPGDVIKFNITIHNESNVSVKYRTAIVRVQNTGLWNGLEITIGETRLQSTKIYTEWDELAPGANDIVVPVEITLPVEAGNEYQGKGCKLAYTVEAIQGNSDAVRYVSTLAQLREAVTKEDGYIIKLSADIDVSADEMIFASDYAAYKYYYPTILEVAKNATIDLNGHYLKYDGDGGNQPFGIYTTKSAVLNIIDSSADQSGEIFCSNDTEGFAVSAFGYSTINIYGGNFGTKGPVCIHKSHSVGTVNIYGGKFYSTEATADGSNGLLNVNNWNGVINVYGGSFRNFQPGVNNAGEVKIGDGYKVVQDGDWYTVVADAD